MDTQSIWVFFILCVLLLILLFQNQIFRSTWVRQLYKWVYSDIMLLPANEGFYQVAWDGFIFFSGITLTLYISKATGMVNMTTMWILVIGFAVIAFIAKIRIKAEPKDTRLDYIVKEVKNMSDNMLDKKTAIELKTAIQELTEELKKARI